MAHGKIKHKKFIKELKAFSDEHRQARIAKRVKVEQAKRRDIEHDNFAPFSTN